MFYLIQVGRYYFDHIYVYRFISHNIFYLQFCENNGGILAEPRSASEMSAIRSLLRKTEGYNYWIGNLLNTFAVGCKSTKNNTFLASRYSI